MPNMMSTKRMSTVSTQRPNHPASTPTTTPITISMAVVATPMNIDSRIP